MEDGVRSTTPSESDLSGALKEALQVKPKRAKATHKPSPTGVSGSKKGVKSSALAAKKNPNELPDGLPKKYFFKSTFNTHDIMHSPVEKTISMIDKILSGERLFTM